MPFGQPVIETNTERDRDRDRERQRQRDRETERDIERDRQRETETDRQRRGRDTDAERYRQRQRENERETDRHRQIERQRDRDRDFVALNQPLSLTGTRSSAAGRHEGRLCSCPEPNRITHYLLPFSPSITEQYLTAHELETVSTCLNCLSETAAGGPQVHKPSVHNYR